VFTALTPLSFLERSASVWADRIAVRDRERQWTYREHHDRVGRAVTVLSELGVRSGDRVATILPNVAGLLELHYAVPGAGAVLVPLNTRLTADDYDYILEHSGARVVVAAASLRDSLAETLTRRAIRTIWLDQDDPEGGDYGALLAAAGPSPIAHPADENDLLSINYTSGTTGRPKGVMTSHRGAYLHSLGVIAESGMTVRSSYLWTLPMFHCNGWAYTWSVTAVGAAHVCLPSLEPAAAWRAIAEAGTTHMCAAPTVLTMLLEDDAAIRCPQPVRVFVGGSPPSPALLGRADAANFAVTQLYGLTETYGPMVVCAWNPDWDELPLQRRLELQARQGVNSIVSDPIRVVDQAMHDVPADGRTLGEVVMTGNNVMLGYYRDPEATATAFAGGWFHTGDLAVMHPDRYFELRDRLKDVVISGGENIATVEIEQALSAHPDVSEVAVVGAPDERWGEAVVAFVVPVRGSTPQTDDLIGFARGRLAGFKVPKRIYLVTELPKTGTGKIQKYVLRGHAAGSPSAVPESPSAPID
jgi:fatty-acyl-CoA synthase